MKKKEFMKRQHNLVASKAKFYLAKGNNEELVKQVLTSRPWWNQVTETRGFNLLWQQWSPHPSFYSSIQRPNVITNHFAGNRQLHSKMTLYNIMQNFYQNNLYNIMMPTYQLHGNGKLKFETHFNYLESLKNGTQFDTDFKGFNQIKKSKESNTASDQIVHIPAAIKATPFEDNQKNLWILKPDEMNRGRGIIVVNNIAQIQEHVEGCQNTTPNISDFQKLNQNEPKNQTTNKLSKIQNIKTTQSFLIQKYIENPLLIEKRKFDIRCYGLITSKGDCYVYNIGYLRLSGQEYSVESDDPAVHLTNNAVQKLTETYQNFEEGNMMTFDDLGLVIQQQFPGKGANYFQQQIWPNIMKTVATSMVAAGEAILGEYASQNCFELFGFDFMIDQKLNFYLIECNSNPCLELSAPISWCILPVMLDDMFELTIDKTFPPLGDVLEMKSKAQRKNYPRYTYKNLEQWKNTPIQDRKVEGMRYWCYLNNFNCDRQNGFIQYANQWKLVK